MKTASYIRGALLLLAGVIQAQEAPVTLPVIRKEPWCVKGCAPARHLDMTGCVRLTPPASSVPVVIAVIDDAFDLTCGALLPFLYVNNAEKIADRVDDDANGYRDDRCGWDVSDMDNDVQVPADRAAEFYHGTYIAGIITEMLTAVFGADAPRLFKILPVKVLSDRAVKSYVIDGYRGIRYAAAAGADVVCCAWSGGVPTTDERDAVAGALDAGAAVVASAGNEYSGKGAFPALMDGVISVAAVDSAFKRPDFSNYHTSVDLCAPGTGVCGPDAAGGDGRLTCRGTSASTAIVTAAVAALKCLYPDNDTGRLLRALKNTARPVDRENKRLAGRMGAGCINLSAAVEYLRQGGAAVQRSVLRQPEGSIVYRFEKGRPARTWRVAPFGTYNGFRFGLNGLAGKCGDSRISFRASPDAAPFASFSPDSLPSGFYVPYDSVTVAFDPDNASRKLVWEMSYAADVIDSTVLYCDGTKAYTALSDTFSDGSGDAPYAGYCSCKWQITAPEGKRVTLLFSDFDTQANVDFVYLYDGDQTVPRNLLAKFSGPGIPPRITSRTNRVLVWFLTDGAVNGRGWTLRYWAQ